jgi:hypothetical protein
MTLLRAKCEVRAKPSIFRFDDFDRPCIIVTRDPFSSNLLLQRIRDSNPCTGLERAVSWASRRMRLEEGGNLNHKLELTSDK